MIAQIFFVFNTYFQCNPLKVTIWKLEVEIKLTNQRLKEDFSWHFLSFLLLMADRHLRSDSWQTLYSLLHTFWSRLQTMERGLRVEVSLSSEAAIPVAHVAR